MFRLYIDKDGSGWKAYGSCLTEGTVKALTDRLLARSWAVKVERV